MNMEKLVGTLAFIAALLPATVAGQEGGIFTPPDPAAGSESCGEHPAPPTASRCAAAWSRSTSTGLRRRGPPWRREARRAPSLRLNLFADAVLTGIVETTSPTPAGYVLSGRIEGIAGSTLTIVVNGTVVAGTIRTAGGTWRIRSAGDGLHVVSRVDESRLPPGAEPLRPPPGDADFSPPLRDPPIEQAAVSKSRASIAPGPR